MKTQTQQKSKQEEYKETELGFLPESWEIVRLGDYCEVFSGYAFKSLDFVDDGTLVVKIGNLQNGTVIVDKRTRYFPTDNISEKTKKYVLKTGDVLIAMTGATTGKVAVVPPEFENSLLNQRVGKFSIFSNDLEKSFFSHYSITNEFQEGVLGNILKSAQGNVSPKQIENINIPLPRLPEQKKIAYVLSAAQEAKEKSQNVINSLKELKKSLMKHLFTYGPVSFEDAEKVKLKETEIGEIPWDWEVVDLQNLVNKTKQKDMRKTDIEFKYIDVSGINRDSFKIAEYKMYKGKKAPSRARKIVMKNDVIIATVRPTLKRIALIGEEFDNQICSTAFCVLRTNKDKLDFSYLYYSIERDQFIENLGKIERGASYPAVTDTDIKNSKIPLPPLPVQQEIASILSSVDEKIEKEEIKRNALEEMFKSMLNNLMTAKERVNNLEVENG